MRTGLRKWWPVLKAVFAIAILVAIGRQFERDLRQLDLEKYPLHLNWLVVAGALYLLGLGISALFWYRLLHQLGQRPTVLAAVRAYYIGHLGKYLPGKAWALLLRATFAREAGVRMGVAAMTSFYEVLTTMVAGVLLAAILLALLAPDTVGGLDWKIVRRLLAMKAGDPAALDRKNLVLLALLLCFGISLPILPPVFNRVMYRIVRPFREADAAPLPHVRTSFLVQGILLIPAGWLLLGGSLWTAFQAIVPAPALWEWELWALFTAFMGVAYVAGFVILVVPSGLGVREFMLTLFLVPALAPRLGFAVEEMRAIVVLAVLVLRLTWTAAELLLAALLYWLPVSTGDLSPGPSGDVLHQVVSPERNPPHISSLGQTDHGPKP